MLIVLDIMPRLKTIQDVQDVIMVTTTTNAYFIRSQNIATSTILYIHTIFVHVCRQSMGSLVLQSHTAKFRPARTRFTRTIAKFGLEKTAIQVTHGCLSQNVVTT